MALKYADDLALLQQLLLDCVCAHLDHVAELVDDYPGCPTCVYPTAGEPAADFCSNCGEGGCGGQLNTWIERVYPYMTWPNQLEGTERPTMGGRGTCVPEGFAASMVVSVLRCAPTIDDDGNPPTPEQMAENARLVAIDVQSVMQAVQCCLDDLLMPGRKRPLRYLLADGQVNTPEGGCVSVDVRVTVDLGRLCPCSTTSPTETAGAGADVPLSAGAGSPARAAR